MHIIYAKGENKHHLYFNINAYHTLILKFTIHIHFQSKIYKCDTFLMKRILTITCILIPPLSFFLRTIWGGSLLRRMPNPSNSCSINRLCTKGFNTSNTMNIKLQVRATENQRTFYVTTFLLFKKHMYIGSKFKVQRTTDK